MLGTFLICTYICAAYCQYETGWELITTDCPDDSCGQVATVDGYLSHLAIRFTPLTTTDTYTRRYIWLYSWSGGLDPLEQGRIMFSEYEGYSIKLSTSCGPVFFASTNLTNTGASRSLFVRATDSGVRITFPDNTTWATCMSWNVTIVAFDKYMKIGAEFTTSPAAHGSGSGYNVSGPGDMCVVAGNTCTNTSYCTEAGFCNGWEESQCEHINNKASICDSCMSQDTISCNSTYECVPPNYICNGVEECENGEDEVDCSNLPDCSDLTEERCGGKAASSSSLKQLKTELCLVIFAVLSLLSSSL